jgi:CheY-like chemotaxis protein
MPKRVLDVGQCGPDHVAICNYLSRHFDCQIESADATHDALAKLKASKFDLVLVNRKLDIDYSDGIDVIRALKADPETAGVPVMLVTNYPQHQELAITAGAIRGFGKLAFGNPETRDKLATVLG